MPSALPWVDGRLGMSPSVLLIDNYDSFSYNLYQLISAVSGGEARRCSAVPEHLCGFLLVTTNDRRSYRATCAGSVDVITHDQVPAAEFRTSLLAGKYDCIVLSPGPGKPSVPEDIGMSLYIGRCAGYD